MIDETAEEIREMQTHSSSVVAVKAARALASVANREYATVEEYLRALERNSTALRRANPSHASLQTTQQDIVARVRAADPETVEAAAERTRTVVETTIERVESAKAAAAKRLADQLGNDVSLLTHDYSTTVLEALEVAAEDGATLSVFATEARPRHLGRKTARRLGSVDGIDPTLIVDSAAGFYLEDCDAVVVGMDCIVGDTLYNRIGTYPIVATAADAGIPVYVAGSSAKIVDSGFRFENDFRAGSEVIREPPEGFTVENPAYDATPLTLVDYLVTDEGLVEPDA
ncbi:MAG: translation initiation factor eIF-2B [Halobacteriaceae archaeon]